MPWFSLTSCAPTSRRTARCPLPAAADSDLAQAIAVLARAQQDAVWDRQQLGNRLRSLLLDYYPAAVTAFAGLNHSGLTRADARAILSLAPSPARAATLTRQQLLTALRKAGRVRLVHADVERLHQLFRAEQMRLPAVVEAAFACASSTLPAPPKTNSPARSRTRSASTRRQRADQLPRRRPPHRRTTARRDRRRPRPLHRRPSAQGLRGSAPVTQTPRS